MYSEEYRNWEELVARRLFSANGIHIDRIAASMHQFVENKRDPEVLAVIELAQRELHFLTHPPPAVDLHLHIGAKEVAELLRRVIELIKKCFAGISLPEYEDARMRSELGLHVMRRFVTAHDVACTKDCLDLETVREMQGALTLRVEGEVVTLTHSQFTMFLDIFCESEELAEVLENFGLPRGREGLRLLRAGREYLNLSVHPLVAYLHQLQRADISNREALYESCLDYMTIHRKLSLAITDQYFEVDTLSLEQSLEVLQANTLALPSFLHAALLCDRASIYFHQGNVSGAAVDCDTAIALDSRYDRAYSLRAECRTALGDLSRAAVDAMAAFVLTGSADMTLASTAELACREVCRSLAKEEFKNRSVTLTHSDFVGDSDPIVVPKEWFVRSYLAGYEGFQSAYNLEFNVCYLIAVEEGLENSFDPEDLPVCDLECIPQHLRDLDSTCLREYDRAAYRLLCKMVYLLDKVYLKGRTEALDVDEVLAQRVSVEEGTKVPVHPISKTRLECLLSENERHRISLESYHWAVHLNDSTDAENDSSTELQELFSFLKNDEFIEISGVHWNSRGHISAVVVDDPYYDIDYSVADASGPIEYIPRISPQLLARLMNISASIAYLCGDTNGSLKCLRYSCYLDHRLTDSLIKLGSLLVDVDEVDEATDLLKTAIEQDPLNPFAYMHRAELQMHQNDFRGAIESLQRANQLAIDFNIRKNGCSSIEQIRAQQDEFRQLELLSNLKALLAVAHFRADPSDPEVRKFEVCMS